MMEGRVGLKVQDMRRPNYSFTMLKSVKCVQVKGGVTVSNLFLFFFNFAARLASSVGTFQPEAIADKDRIARNNTHSHIPTSEMCSRVSLYVHTEAQSVFSLDFTLPPSFPVITCRLSIMVD